MCFRGELALKNDFSTYAFFGENFEQQCMGDSTVNDVDLAATGIEGIETGLCFR